MARGTLLTTLALALVLLPSALAEEAAQAPGTLRFSNTPDAFPEKQPATFGPSDTLYARAVFGKPWKELMRKARKGTSATVQVYLGEEHKGSAAFYPDVEAFEQETYVLDVLPEPAKATQFTFGVPRSLASLEPGRHELRIVLGSFDAATEGRVLAEGRIVFEATQEGQQQLLDLVEALKEEKQRRSEAATQPAKPEEPRVTVRRGGSELLYFRGDEIVLEGAVVGRFEGNQVRRGGAIVGEIRGRTFRHEGADAWSLDKGNLYPGIEVRWQGAIIGDVRPDGGIWWEGSDWGSVRPFTGKDEETMRLFAALFYFSDFFQRK